MLFTVSEANAALPDIVRRFELAAAKKLNISRIQAQLSTDASLEDYVKFKQKLNTAIVEYYMAVDSLESTGVMIKSIEEGLLDFPSRRFDKDVWLCWKYGEKQVAFWHEIDSGFMGRKPLAIQDESLV